MPLIKFRSPEIERAYHAETDIGKKVNLAFAGVMGHVPKANKYLVAVKAAANHDGTLGDRLVELVRIRMAYHTQCRTRMTLRFKQGLESGVNQDLVCALERPQEADNLTDRERKALEYTDRFALDWSSIDAKYFQSMRRLFTEAEIVQLGLICARRLGSGRLMASYAVTEDCPRSCRAPQPITATSPGRSISTRWCVSRCRTMLPKASQKLIGGSCSNWPASHGGADCLKLLQRV